MNAAYRNVPKVGRVKTTTYRMFEKEMALWTLENRDQLKVFTASKQPLALYLYFYLPDWFTKKKAIRKKDLGNCLKCIEDSLAKALQIDDSEFFEIHLFKCVSSRAYVDCLITDELIDCPGVLRLNWVQPKFDISKGS